MSSPEEGFVDREVEAAWLQFRVRLADHVAAMVPDDTLSLGVEGPDGDHDVLLDVWARDRSFRAGWIFSDAVDRIGAPHDKTVRFAPRSIDAWVRGVHDVLRAEGAVHPSFVDVLDGDLVLVDVPETGVVDEPEVQLPDSIAATTHADLVAWVERVVAEHLVGEPMRSDEGSLCLQRPEGQVVVKVWERPIIEVWAVVARGVDVRRARKWVARMNAGFHFFSFALVRDAVYVATTVNADPFCPDHLRRAIHSTFDYLQEAASELQGRLARREPKPSQQRPSTSQHSNVVDTDLLLVFGASADRRAMVEMARGLAGDSRSRLGRWGKAAREAADEARAKAALGGPDVVQNALIDQVIAWRSVAEALESAVAEIVAEHGSSR